MRSTIPGMVEVEAGQVNFVEQSEVYCSGISTGEGQVELLNYDDCSRQAIVFF